MIIKLILNTIFSPFICIEPFIVQFYNLSPDFEYDVCFEDNIM